MTDKPKKQRLSKYFQHPEALQTAMNYQKVNGEMPETLDKVRLRTDYDRAIKAIPIVKMEDLDEDEILRRLELGERLDIRTAEQRMRAIIAEYGEGVFDAYEWETPANARAMETEDMNWYKNHDPKGWRHMNK